MMRLNCLQAHGFDHEFACKVQFAFEHDQTARRRGLNVCQYAELIARREACDQLENLLIFRDALTERAEYVPGVGAMYPWELVQWIFSGYEYNYLHQFYKFGILSEPQGGLVSIDWAAVVSTMTESRVVTASVVRRMLML